MATLGDLLASARDAAHELDRRLSASDPDLAARVREAADRMGMSTAGFSRMAVAEFGRFAAEEDWATLMSSLSKSSDPGATCLTAMVHWRLTAPTCADHSEQTSARRT